MKRQRSSLKKTYVRSEAHTSPSSSSRIYKYQAICKRKPSLDKMVQTKAGTKNNPWLEHLRQCAADYQRRKAVEQASSDEEQRAVGTTSTAKQPIRRRVVGKKSEAMTLAPPKAKLLVEKDIKKPAKTVKAHGKQKAKKAAE